MPINEIDIVQTPSGQLVTEIELQQGLPGPPNTLAIGTVTPAETGVPAAASITGSSPSQLLHLTLPKGNTGTAATISAGTTTTGAAGSSASVTNVGTNSAAVFNFTIPRGNTGNTGTAATISAGTTTTGAAGSSASVTNVGTSSAAVFNFTIPRGNTGATGPATQLSVASTSTGSAGSEASVTISGDAPNQSLAFTIPRGNTGATGPATQLSVASTTTGAAGSNASVTISGTAPNQSLAFTIPTGPQGPQGPTGSSGATALLTGYVSGAGTVAATDTVIQAVGKLNGNDELKAPIASLYPYIGGKLLTYLDEEAAIDDPLISAGDIYRKTAGGVDYVNPDNVPSLDLRFATDKTLTARRGPTPVFTRGSTGTFVGSDGLIQSAAINTPRFDHDPISRTNLLVRSNELNISPWGPATVTVEAVAGSGLDGGNAWRLTPTGSDSALGQARTIAASSTHTFSVWLKSDTGSNVSLSLSVWDNTASTNRGVKSITVTTQWQRFDITTSTVVAGNTTSFNIGAFGSWATGENILAWGAQVEAGSTATSYIPTTTASVTIRDCRGLLIEEGRTNLFSSTNFNDWSTARVTKTAITGIGLTNQATTLTISETGSTYISRGATLTTSVAYAISVRVKAGTVASFSFADLIDGKYSRGFNLSTNQWAASGGAAEFTNYTVTPNIDGWFLVSAIYTPTGATGLKTIAFLLNTPVVGQTVSFDTPQIEAGSFPTSYIPTTTGTLARSADVCSITGGDFNNFYNQSEGTLFADVSGLMPDVLGGNRGFAVITDGTYNNQIGIYKVASFAFIGAAGNTGNVSQFTLNNAYVPFTQYKVALGVKTNDTNAAFNGSLKLTDTSVTLPSTMNRLEFRDATAAAGGQPSCHLAALRYYRKRLPDAKLQALTV